MATILKIACPRCGQRVSGDESFYGVEVDCPVCSAKIPFPENPEEEGIGRSRERDKDGERQEIGNGADWSAPERTESPEKLSASPGVSPSASPGGLSGGAAALREEEPLPLYDFASSPERGSELRWGTEEASGAFSGHSHDTRGGGGYPDAGYAGGEFDEEEVPSPLLGAVSLVSGLLGLVTFCVGGILFAPLAIIFGHTALARASDSPVQPAPGKGLATAGVLIGYLNLLFLIVALVAAVLFGDQMREMWRGHFG